LKQQSLKAVSDI